MPELLVVGLFVEKEGPGRNASFVDSVEAATIAARRMADEDGLSCMARLGILNTE
jgi:hypothetical protein